MAGLRSATVLRRKRSMARRFRGEPRAGVFGDLGSRPLFQGGEEGFLREVFGEADVAGEAGDDSGGLDAPDGFDGAV
jgi:hypothetical protein